MAISTLATLPLREEADPGVEVFAVREEALSRFFSMLVVAAGTLLGVLLAAVVGRASRLVLRWASPAVSARTESAFSTLTSVVG